MRRKNGSSFITMIIIFTSSTTAIVIVIMIMYCLNCGWCHTNWVSSTCHEFPVGLNDGWYDGLTGQYSDEGMVLFKTMFKPADLASNEVSKSDQKLVLALNIDWMCKHCSCRAADLELHGSNANSPMARPLVYLSQLNRQRTKKIAYYYKWTDGCTCLDDSTLLLILLLLLLLHG